MVKKEEYKNINDNKDIFKINCIYSKNGESFIKIVSDAFKCYYQNIQRI